MGGWSDGTTKGASIPVRTWERSFAGTAQKVLSLAGRM
jgi:hypothetical protein